MSRRVAKGLAKKSGALGDWGGVIARRAEDSTKEWTWPEGLSQGHYDTGAEARRDERQFVRSMNQPTAYLPPITWPQTAFPSNWGEGYYA